MIKLLLVGLGGGLGAMSRYGVGQLFLSLDKASRFPFATLTVNVLGCLAIAIVFGLSERTQVFGANTRLLLVTGFLGGFTTFSTFGLDTFLLLKRGEALSALGYVAASLVLCFFAVWLGLKITLAWISHQL